MPGMDLLFNGDSEASREYNFFIKGDLGQMSSQNRFLLGRDFDVQQKSVYPVIRECDVENALKLIYQNRVDGWWHYQEKYKEFGICSKEEFKEVLHNQVEAEKEEWKNRDKNKPLRFRF